MNHTTHGPIKITYFGHASILLEHNGVKFYIDPYVIGRNAPRADAVFHTHSHFDHCALPKAILSPSTQVISRGGKFPGQEVKVGETINAHGIKIDVVHAYNTNKSFHPKGFGAGFIFNFPTAREPIKVYIAGDTDLIPEMGNYKCDVAILPIGGTYTMNADEAAQALKTLNPKIAIPYHYNYLDDTKADAKEFEKMAKTLNPNVNVRILNP